MSKGQSKCVLVLVTAPDRRTARKLAAKALRAQLIACANLIPHIESHYRWQGELEQGTEVLMLLKTTGSRLAALERLVITEHPYDTPEFIVLPIVHGHRRYLNWLRASVP